MSGRVWTPDDAADRLGPLAEGLACFYPLDEAGGQVRCALSGRAATTAGIGVQAAEGGLARSFAKDVSRYVGLGAAALGPRLAGGSGCTLAAWVRAESLTPAGTDGDDLVVVWHSTGSLASLRLSYGIGSLRVLTPGIRRAAGDSVHSRLGATPLATGRWYHVAVSVTWGGAVFCYLDGRDDTGALASGSPATTTAGVCVHTPGSNQDSIGSAMGTTAPLSTARQFDGAMRGLAVWARGLSAAEVAAYYAAELDRLRSEERTWIWMDGAAYGEEYPGGFRPAGQAAPAVATYRGGFRRAA